MKSRIVLVLITLLCAATASVQSARSATITVTNTNDSGPSSLRDALAIANDGDTINFDSSLNGQEITLTSGQLNVDKDVTITGLGSTNLAVDGNGQSVVFSINPGKTVTIQGLTVENGTIGIYNIDATLTVSNCIVSGNSSTGIINSGGFRNGATLTSPNCTVSGNFDGGITNAAAVGSATVTITESTVSGNSGAWGGGIANFNTRWQAC